MGHPLLRRKEGALEREDLDTSIATSKESFIASLFPKTMELLGECLYRRPTQDCLPVVTNNRRGNP